ncbi:hypothetical protein [Streptomyces sp. NPDC051776]|uniref:hypothetical protein n=1 Tax=Streptomyces sp. NPDC051776 TaxID=3155414 RepID=UPI00342F1707
MMHLNWKTDVTLPMYRDPGLNAALQAHIRAATDDGLLSTLLHFLEGHVALALYRDFDQLLAGLREEQALAGKLVHDDDSPSCFEYSRANFVLLRDLSALTMEAEKIRNEVGKVWHSSVQPPPGTSRLLPAGGWSGRVRTRRDRPSYPGRGRFLEASGRRPDEALRCRA